MMAIKDLFYVPGSGGAPDVVPPICQAIIKGDLSC